MYADDASESFHGCSSLFMGSYIGKYGDPTLFNSPIAVRCLSLWIAVVCLSPHKAWKLWREMNRLEVK